MQIATLERTNPYRVESLQENLDLLKTSDPNGVILTICR